MNINIPLESRAAGANHEAAASTTTTTEIGAQSVIQLILQFLREQNLTHSFQCVQRETGVFLNSVENKAEFVEGVIAGNLKLLLDVASQTKLPRSALFDVFEHVCCELLDVGDKEAFDKWFAESEFANNLGELSVTDRAKLTRLKVLRDNDGQIKDLWLNTCKAKRRKYIAKTIASYVVELPPHSLVSLLASNQNLKAKAQSPSVELYVERNFPTPSQLSCVRVLENELIACGMSNGQILLLDPRTGDPVGDIMCGDSQPVSALCLSHDQRVLAAGSALGSIFLWKLADHKLGLEIKSVHLGAVKSIVFHPTEPILLSMGADATVKTTAITSSTVTQSIRSPVEDVPFIGAFYTSSKAKNIVACLANGLLATYNAKTGALINSTELLESAEFELRSCHKEGPDIICILDKGVLVVEAKTGCVVHRLTTETKISDAFSYEDAMCCVSEERLLVYDSNGTVTHEAPIEKLTHASAISGKIVALWRDGGRLIAVARHT